jgi:hypothetical protein
VSFRLFFSAPCLNAQGTSLTAQQLLERGFKEPRYDKRYVTQAISKFISYNQELFSFLSVIPSIEGLDPNPRLRLQTGQYVGAIPLRMPTSGKQGGDLLVYPRFGRSDEAFAKLTYIMSLLEEVIRPEFFPSLPLASGVMVHPPLYYDALKYIDLFEVALCRKWRKFQTHQRMYPYPKASTCWDAYAKRSHLPEQFFCYPVSESVLSPNHQEWQTLKNILLLAIEELKKPITPQRLRLQGLRKAEALLQKTKDIRPYPSQTIIIRFNDPKMIKALKEQAQVLLKQEGSIHSAWRIDIAVLFERYVQHILRQAVAGLPARMLSNPRFTGQGNIPTWGLRQLEPDALILAEKLAIPVDAKYKAHFYGRGVVSDVLKESHRADLHQILAYCSFSRSMTKTGLLVYPADEYSQRCLDYWNPHLSLTNTIWLIGLPFDADALTDSVRKSRQLLATLVAPAV